MNSKGSKSNRLKGYDYRLPGAYFVTLVTLKRQPLFGKLVGEEMRLNDVGQIVAQEWAKNRRDSERGLLDSYVVMPNHFHAIVFNHEALLDRRTVAAHGRAQLRRPPGSLGSIIAGFKSAASAHAKQKLWQRNYHDRIIRNEDKLNKIKEYILYNPLLFSQIIKNNPD